MQLRLVLSCIKWYKIILNTKVTCRNKVLIIPYHSNRLWTQDLVDGQCRVECHIRHDIHNSYQSARDGNSTGQIPDWVFQLFNDEIEVVPATCDIMKQEWKGARCTLSKCTTGFDVNSFYINKSTAVKQMAQISHRNETTIFLLFCYP